MAARLPGRAVGVCCLKLAPATWLPVSQWKSGKGCDLRVVADEPRMDLEEGLRLIEACVAGSK